MKPDTKRIAFAELLTATLAWLLWGAEHCSVLSVDWKFAQFTLFFGFWFAYFVMGDTREYRVYYPEGGRSIKMCKKQAKDYASVFNGKIELA